ncbi:hypothetical protein AVEN_23227-1 [Araneus ventricosus]|uniref:Uncharacterized protein n=1 Tax=Araneus ventricosus TaxID=182803 RepID=A0A4Y2MIJ9_ARAVE|nr:hypothetical protein AVEN_191627-1 [Araneus ventricosus]GBN25456.1 hypothetical protein AVEN_23227-1 [Araneus ventricosus]
MTEISAPVSIKNRNPVDLSAKNILLDWPYTLVASSDGLSSFPDCNCKVFCNFWPCFQIYDESNKFQHWGRIFVNSNGFQTIFHEVDFGIVFSTLFWCFGDL